MRPIIRFYTLNSDKDRERLLSEKEQENLFAIAIRNYHNVCDKYGHHFYRKTKI